MFRPASFLDKLRRNPASPAGSPYWSENSFSACVPVTLRMAAGMNVLSSHSGGNTPMPGCGLSLTEWNMPRISAAASTGGRRAGADGDACGARSPAAPGPRGASPAAVSRTKKPRLRRASTRPCASSWS